MTKWTWPLPPAPQGEFTAEQLVRAAHDLGYKVSLRERGDEFRGVPYRSITVSLRMEGDDEQGPAQCSRNRIAHVSDGPDRIAETATWCVREFFSKLTTQDEIVWPTVLDHVLASLAS